MEPKRYPLDTDQVVNVSSIAGAFLSDALANAGSAPELAIADFYGPGSQETISGSTDIPLDTIGFESHSGLWFLASDGSITCSEAGNTLVVCSGMTDVTDTVRSVGRWFPSVWTGSSWAAKSYAIGWNYNRNNTTGKASSGRHFSFAAAVNDRVKMTAAEVVGTNVVVPADALCVTMLKIKD